MNNKIRIRAYKIGQHIINTHDTVRKTANVFGVGKSTAHKDVSERLPNINLQCYSEVSEILAHHKSVRHIRGGEATRQKHKRQVVM